MTDNSKFSSNRKVEPKAIAEQEGVLAVYVRTVGVLSNCGARGVYYGIEADALGPMLCALSDACAVSETEVLASMGNRTVVRVVRDGKWSLAVAMAVGQSKCSAAKSMPRTMRKCLKNLSEGKVQP